MFGQVYLEAFRRDDCPFELAGLLARGSDRAQSCARFYGTRLYTSVDELPSDIDAACVVVRSRILGGMGTEIAHALMRRGMHVIQEHPVHPGEMAESLRVAREEGVLYKLNSFYVNVGPVRRFIGAARSLCRDEQPLFVDAACGCQLSFSLLDIIGASMGSPRPWAIEDVTHAPGDPIVTLQGRFAGVPVAVRVQNQLDPADPDGFSYFLHRLTLSFSQGNLSLVDTHGPVVWTPRPRFPREVRREDAPPQFSSGSEVDDETRSTIVGPAQSSSFGRIFRRDWPEGVVRALFGLRRSMEKKANPLSDGQYHLTLCELWRDMLAKAGPPEPVQGKPVSPLPAESLAALRRAAAEMERMP